MFLPRPATADVQLAISSAYAELCRARKPSVQRVLDV